MFLSLQGSVDSGQTIPTGPIFVYECLWKGCDYQYEDLHDMRIHLLDSTCHLRKSGEHQVVTSKEIVNPISRIPPLKGWKYGI